MQHRELERVLGFWAAVSIVIGTAIGSGIFLVPSEMIRAVGTPSMVFVVWIFGGVLSLFGALTYGELSAALPGAGGEYVYLNAAYGPLWGFIYGWTQTWVAKTASIATLATGFYRYASDFFPVLQQAIFIIPLPLGPGGKELTVIYGQLLGIVLILFLSGVNYLGVRLGGSVQIAVTGLKIALIAGIVAAGLWGGHASAASLQTSVTPMPGGVAGFFAALVAALWAYDGWNNAGMVASEIENPQRNLPRALILGTTAMIGIYLLANLAYFAVLPAQAVAGSQRVASDMMLQIAGPWGASAVSAAAMISIFAALNGSILSGSRVPFAMARDERFFSRFAAIHPRYRTPGSSLILLGIWASVLLLSGQYRELYTLVIFPSWILYGMAAASAIVLRIRRPDLARPYRTWGYPVVPAVFVLVTVALLYSTYQESPRESGMGLFLILSGLPFYAWFRRRANK